MLSISEPILTLDIDWAPDCVIDQVAGFLTENKVRATWFVTHHSDAIERLREHPELFELGIHPNMLAGSSHGTSEDDVLAHMKEIVPNSVCMRTHGLYQTSNWLVKAAKSGVLVDVSLFLPRAVNLTPHFTRWNGTSLLRIPYFWEDDSEMFEENPIWRISDHRLNVGGLRVFDFHPIHIALNTSSYEKYETLKTIKPLTSWDAEFIKENESSDIGPKNFFLELVNHLKGKGRRIKDLLSEQI